MECQAAGEASDRPTLAMYTRLDTLMPAVDRQRYVTWSGSTKGVAYVIAPYGDKERVTVPSLATYSTLHGRTYITASGRAVTVAVVSLALLRRTLPLFNVANLTSWSDVSAWWLAY